MFTKSNANFSVLIVQIRCRNFWKV